MIFYYLMIIIMTFTASFGSFFLKKSAISVNLKSIITNRFLYIGGLLYIAAALINIWLLQKLPYFMVVPLGSLCYIWTMIIAAVFLKEKINLGKILGILLIFSGVICMVL